MWLNKSVITNKGEFDVRHKFIDHPNGMKSGHIYLYISTEYMSGFIPNQKSTFGYIFTFTDEFLLWSRSLVTLKM